LSAWLLAFVGGALVSALLAGGAGSTTGTSGLIAFTRSDGIYVMRADGSATRVLRRGGEPRALAWSPDGRKLAFVASQGSNGQAIWVMNADGSDPVRLVEGGYSPTWSPDGGRIAFSGELPDRKGPGIWVVNADGRDLRRLVRINAGDVDWSPVGGRIAFDTLRGYVPRLQLMNVNGGRVRELLVGGLAPDWSPSGRRIVFWHWGNAAGSEEIHAVDVSDRQQVRLTRNEVADVDPAWSPDGRRVVFVRSDRDPHSTNAELYVMNADGRGVRRLTHHHGADGSPAWRPVTAE